MKPLNRALAFLGVLSLVLLAPTLAMAKTAKVASRIKGLSSQFVVDDSDPGVTATPAIAAGKVYAYRKASRKYVAVSATVRLYLRSEDTGDWMFVTSQSNAAAAGFALPLAARGEYEVRYSGASKVKATVAYTVRRDQVASAIPTPTVTVEPIDADHSKVSITTTVTWNANAYSGKGLMETIWMTSDEPTFDSFAGSSESLLDGTFGILLMSCPRPDAYTVTATVNNTDLLQYVFAGSAVAFLDPYVLSPTTNPDPAVVPVK